MELLDPFPFVEDIAEAIFEPLDATVARHRPNPLVLPLVQIVGGGSTDDGTTETARVEVQCLTNDPDATKNLAKACQQRVLASPAGLFAGHCVDTARTDVGPRFVDYGNPEVFRMVASYVISYRR